MKTLSVSNHKGGVGKTATVRALGDVLSAAGLRVLMIDTDPQSSLTTSCGLADVTPSLAEVMGGATHGTKELSEVIVHVHEGLDLVPANLALAGTELGLNSRLGREAVLRKVMAPTANKYDVCLIDTPPSLSLLTVNSLAASDSVLIPSQPMPIDVAGVRLFLETIDVLRQDVNPSLTILGIVLTFYDGRLNAHQGALEAMQRAGWPVLPVRIGRSVRVGEAAGLGESILTFEKGNPQAAAYEELGKVVMTWLQSAKRR